MIQALKYIASWITETVFLLLLLVSSNLALAFPPQVQINFNVKVCEQSLELESDFNSQVIECHFPDFCISFLGISVLENALTKGVLRNAAKGSSKILNFTTKQLQAKFKHAADFGVKGNWNKAAAGKFNSAINQHINSSGVRAIQGTYRGNPVTHYLNPNTGLNVISGPNGQFISGWKLNPGQLQNVLKHGGL